MIILVRKWHCPGLLGLLDFWCLITGIAVLASKGQNGHKREHQASLKPSKTESPSKHLHKSRTESMGWANLVIYITCFRHVEEHEVIPFHNMAASCIQA